MSAYRVDVFFRTDSVLQIFYPDSMEKLRLIPALLLVGITLTVGPKLVFADPVPGCCKVASNTSLTAAQVVIILRCLGIM